MRRNHKQNQEIQTTSSTNCKEIVKRNQEILKTSSNISNSCEEIVKQNQEMQITSSNRSNSREEIFQEIQTHHELNALAAGMEEYGTSCSRIYEKYGNAHGVLCNRSQVQLKDKARNEKLRRKKYGIEVGVFELATGD
ncbi:16400_t:CDS:2 [Gigaspora rosea]|nr:16400_t:CDS:2 [Gigaspora rosea]